MRKILLAATTVLFLAFSKGAVVAQSGYDLYQKALVKERAAGDLEEALRLYQRVVSEFGSNRALAAKAQFRIGLLYERLGRRAQAQQVFQTIVSQYPDQIDTAGKAQAKVADTAQIRKKPPSAIVKETGPSADGWYKTTFTLLTEQTRLRAVVDSNAHKLYAITWWAGEPRNDAERMRVQQQGFHDYYEPSTLIVISTETNAIVKTIPLSVYIDEIAFNPVNNKIYATAQLDGYVKVIDTHTFVQSRLDLPGQPTGIAVNASTNRIYVTSQGFGGNDKLFVIDGATNALAGPYDLDGVAGEVVINSATNRIYAAASLRTRVFNGADNSIVADLTVSVVGADAFQNVIYAMAGDGFGKIQALDGNTHSLIWSTEFSSRVSAVGVVPGVGRLYATLPQKSQIAIVDTTTHSELGRLQVSDAPTLLTVDSRTNDTYVIHWSDLSIMGILDARGVEKEAPEEFSEAFNSPRLGSSWTVESGQGSYSLTENPGHLRVRVAKPLGSKPRLALMRGFRGDHWMLEVKPSYFTGASGGSRALAFGVTLGSIQLAKGFGKGVSRTPTNAVYIHRTRGDWDGCCPGEIMAHIVEAGKAVSLRVLAPNQADAYVWRIRREGRTISVERSDDGIDFSPVSSHTFGPEIDRVIQFFGISYDSYANNDAYVDFDYVRLTRTATP